MTDAAIVVALGVLAIGWAGYALTLRRKLERRGVWIDTGEIAAGLLKPSDAFVFDGISYRCTRNVPEGVFGAPLTSGGAFADRPDRRFEHTQRVMILLGWGFKNANDS